MGQLIKTAFVAAILSIGPLITPSIGTAQDAVFEIDTLNVGLPGDRADLDLATPQSSMETFLEAAAGQDWLTAAQVLDLSQFDEAEQASVGPTLAQQLSVILDRKVVISWQSLLERPDSLDANAPSENPMAGQPRKSLLLGLLELEDRSVAVRLNRLKPEDEPAVWVFSKQTVDNVPALYELHGPTELEQSLPEWMQSEALGGLRMWEVIVLPLMALLAVASAYATWRSFGWVTSASPSSIGAALLRGVRAPATLTVLAVVIQAMTERVFVVSGIVANVVEPIIVLAYVAALMILIVNAIDAVLDFLTPSDVTDLTEPDAADSRSLVTTLSATRRIVIVIAVIAGTGLVLASTNVFRVLGFSLLASAGALTLILGFAAREVLGNILASLQIALNRSARVGDQLLYDGHLVTVERIHFTYVQLHVWDDTRLIVPVLKFVSEAFVNRNLVDPGMTRTVTLKLSNRIDIDALRSAFQDYIAGREAIDAEDANCLVTGQDETGMDIRFAIPVPNPVDAWDEEVALREAMLKAAQKQEVRQNDDLVPHMGLSPNPKSGRADSAIEIDEDDAA